MNSIGVFHLQLLYNRETNIMDRRFIPKYQHFASILTFALITIASVEYAFADALSDRIQDVADAKTAPDLVQSILYVAIPIAVLCLVGLGVVASYKMLTSRGNPDKINEAREIITNGVIGFALIGLSVAILLLIQDVLQLP